MYIPREEIEKLTDEMAAEGDQYCADPFIRKSVVRSRLLTAAQIKKQLASSAARQPDGKIPGLARCLINMTAYDLIVLEKSPDYLKMLTQMAGQSLAGRRQLLEVFLQGDVQEYCDELDGDLICISFRTPLKNLPLRKKFEQFSKQYYWFNPGKGEGETILELLAMLPKLGAWKAEIRDRKKKKGHYQ